MLLAVATLASFLQQFSCRIYRFNTFGGSKRATEVTFNLVAQSCNIGDIAATQALNHYF